MKRISLVVLLPLILTACSAWKQPTAERRATKERCVAGDYLACSEIGHLAREEMNAQAAE